LHFLFPARLGVGFAFSHSASTSPSASAFHVRVLSLSFWPGSTFLSLGFRFALFHQQAAEVPAETGSVELLGGLCRNPFDSLLNSDY